MTILIDAGWSVGVLVRTCPQVEQILSASDIARSKSCTVHRETESVTDGDVAYIVGAVDGALEFCVSACCSAKAVGGCLLTDEHGAGSTERFGTGEAADFACARAPASVEEVVVVGVV